VKKEKETRAETSFLAMFFFFSDRNGTWQPSRTLDRGPPPSPSPLSPMSFYAPPNQQRTLRACMVCSVVQLHNVRAPTPGIATPSWIADR
jgi:hypothetical protein